MVNLSFDINNTLHIERFCGNAQQLNLDSSRLFEKSKNWHAIACKYQDDTISLWTDWLLIQNEWIKGQLTEIAWAANQSAIAASMNFFDDLRKLLEKVQLRDINEPWAVFADETKACFGYTYNATIHDKVKWGINTEREQMLDRISREIVEQQLNNVCSHLKGNQPAIYRFLSTHPNGVTFSEFKNYRDPVTGNQLTTSDNDESISAMLRALSREIKVFYERIEASKTKNIIRLISTK